MKTALLVMLHGSPWPASSEPALRAVEDVRQRGIFDLVAVGYLECNQPPIAEAIRQCVEAGATRVVALPCFLHAGTHVVCDLPALLEAARAAWPAVEFLMTPFLGRSDVVTAILARRAREASLAPPRQ
jgi:sirohydrochlorin ferrochelatase